MRTLLLAGLVGFTLIGTGGVALAEGAKPDDGQLWTTPNSTPKVKAADTKQRAATEEQPPEVGVAGGCLIPEPPDTGVGMGLVVVNVKNPNEPPTNDQVAATAEADITYTVALFKGNAEFKQKKLTLAPGAEDTVPFKDVPGGVFHVKVASDKATQETEEFEIDRCKEIKPVDDALQIFSRCADGKGLVTVRVFGLTAEAKEYTVTINDGEPQKFELGERDYVVIGDEEPTPDGPFKVQVTAPGGVNTTETVNVACGSPTTTPTTTTTPPVQGRPAANTGSGELANTGASVVWLGVAGVLVLGLGAGLVLFGRRRRAASPK